MKRSWIIGGAPDCDLVVDHQAVSAQHCRLTAVGGTGDYLLEDLGSTNGTFVDGRQVRGPLRVSPENVITLGRSQRMPWPDALAPSAFPRPDSGPWVIRIGREPDNDLVVDLPTVSSYHARVVWTGRSDQAEIEDLGSSNGTAVGAPDRRAARALVAPNDTIYLGTYPLPASRVFEALGATQAQTQARPGELRVGAEPVVIGRDPECDRVVDQAVVSSRHARLSRRPDGSVAVEDLGSSNGTSINGRGIDRVGIARAGDVIGLGSYELVLAVEPIGTIPIPLDPDTGAIRVRTGLESEPESEPLGWRPLLRPLALVALGPLAALLAVASAGFDPRSLNQAAEWTGASQALAALVSRLGLAAVGLGLVIGAALGPDSWFPGAGLGRWLTHAAVAGLLCLVAGLLEWGTFRILSGANLAALSGLGLLWLGAGVGLALGLIVVAVAARPAVAWGLLTLLALLFWGLGGESRSWLALPAWAQWAASLNPARWMFEGLLLNVSAQVPAPAGTVGDLAEPYFPAETVRTGPLAVSLALGAMLLGWGVVAAFIAAETRYSPASERPAS